MCLFPTCLGHTHGSATVNDVALRCIVIGMGKVSRSIGSASCKPASRSGRWVSTGKGEPFTQSTVNRGQMRWRTAPGSNSKTRFSGTSERWAQVIDAMGGSEANMSNHFPKGWDRGRVQRVLVHYERLSEDEQVAEDEAAFGRIPVRVPTPRA